MEKNKLTLIEERFLILNKKFNDDESILFENNYLDENIKILNELKKIG